MLKKIMHARAVSVLSLGAFLLALGGPLWAYFALRGAAGAPLILHFDDISGITAVGPLVGITLVGLFGLAAAIINFFIAIELDARSRFLGKLVAAITFLFTVLLFISFAAIINVN